VTVGAFFAMAESDQAAVTIEVELADSSSGPEGPFQSVIQIRISSTDKQACEMVKEAVQLAIQTALEDAEPQSERRH
jgi:hypothetical protein